MQIRNLVFEGGGIKAIAYGGALKGFVENCDLQGVQRVGGTSAGAIFSVLIALNYSIDEIQDMFLGMDFKQFMDDDFGFIRDTGRLLSQFGWYKGNAFLRWIKGIVAAKTGSPDTSFAQLKAMTDQGKQKFKDLYIIGSNLNTGNAEVFCHENQHAGVPIALAVRISGSIPILFKPIILNKAHYVDGGVIRNYPITLFDDWKYNPNIPHETLLPFNQETLGFRVDTQDEIKHFLDPSLDNRKYAIHSFFHYIHALISLIYNVQDEGHLHSFDQFRTIYCDSLDVNSTEFKISMEKRRKVMASGYRAATHYFQEDQYQQRINQRNIYQRNWSAFSDLSILQKRKSAHWLNLNLAPDAESILEKNANGDAGSQQYGSA